MVIACRNCLVTVSSSDVQADVIDATATAAAAAAAGSQDCFAAVMSAAFTRFSLPICLSASEKTMSSSATNLSAALMVVYRSKIDHRPRDFEQYTICAFMIAFIVRMTAFVTCVTAATVVFTYRCVSTVSGRVTNS